MRSKLTLVVITSQLLTGHFALLNPFGRTTNGDRSDVALNVVQPLQKGYCMKSLAATRMQLDHTGPVSISFLALHASLKSHPCSQLSSTCVFDVPAQC